MDDIVHTMQNAQYEKAVTSSNNPSSPWKTPTPEEAAEFEAAMDKKYPGFKTKAEVVRNRLGRYLVEQCGDAEWDTSPELVEYMLAQWNRKNHVTLEDFREFRTLGRGGFGMVTGVNRRTSGAMLAIKVQNKLRVKAGRAEKLCLAEREALCKITSPFIVKVHYAFQDDKDLYLAMELLSGGDLSFHLSKQGKFAEEVARYFLACTIQGIGAIHDIGYVYRDLKPENILLGSTGHCKISDLGLAKRVSKSKGVSGSAGTRGYWAPEMITKGEDGKSQSYGFEVDFWSLGCVAYAFFDGTCPFYHERIHELYGKDSKIAIDEATKNMEIEYGNNFPDLAKSLCEGLLTRDPKARLGCDGWKEVQKHAFFEGMDLESLVAGSFAPPFVPKDALNANDQNQIGAFDKAAKGTKWEPDDQAKFDDWGFTHKERFYDEFIASLEWAKEEGNTDLRYAVKKSSACVIL